METHFRSVDPFCETPLPEWPLHTSAQIEQTLDAAVRAYHAWRSLPVARRAECFARLAILIREKTPVLARLITGEMGKPITEARSELGKCAWACEYYAEHAEALLAPDSAPSDGTRSYVRHDPLGVILAIMPWNFPFWQIVRQAAPTMMAGNVIVLKHAPNVCACAAACTELFAAAGFPEGTFAHLFVDVETTGALIGDDRIAGVALTGSERAGRSVAALAGAALKPVVLELGGSDPFLVLADADLDHTVAGALLGRFLNGGQSCVAAKRLIVEAPIADRFVGRLREGIAALRIGDPMADNTQIGPMARADLRDALHAQVLASIGAGARLELGGHFLPPPGFFYAPTLLTDVAPGMPAFDEELFGPVACVTVARNRAHLLELANQTRYGLGASIWSTNPAAAEELAPHLEAGNVMINGIVKSDPRLPFGGIRASGLGRELGRAGLLAFTNTKTVWVR